jgi:hypothetical protein
LPAPAPFGRLSSDQQVALDNALGALGYRYLARNLMEQGTDIDQALLCALVAWDRRENRLREEI